MKRILQFLIIVLITSSCKKDNSHSDLIIESFPMEIGTTWVYNWELITKHYDVDNLNSVVSIDTVIMSTTRLIEKDTILFDTLKVKVFKNSKTGFLENSDFRTYEYISNQGLWNITLPVDKYPAHFNKRLALPLSWNSKWYGNESNKDNNLKVIEQEIIEMNGHNYMCHKVKPIQRGESFERGYLWYSEIGCLKEVHLGEIHMSNYPSYDSEEIDDKALLETHPVKTNITITLVDFYQK